MCLQPEASLRGFPQAAGTDPNNAMKQRRSATEVSTLKICIRSLWMGEICAKLAERCSCRLTHERSLYARELSRGVLGRVAYLKARASEKPSVGPDRFCTCVGCRYPLRGATWTSSGWDHLHTSDESSISHFHRLAASSGQTLYS